MSTTNTGRSYIMEFEKGKRGRRIISHRPPPPISSQHQNERGDDESNNIPCRFLPFSVCNIVSN